MKLKKITLLLVVFTVLSLSLGCVSAADFEDTNSTIISVDENSQTEDLNHIDDNFQNEVLKSDESASFEEGNVTVTIYDMKHPDQSIITSDENNTAEIMCNITKSGDGFSDEHLEIFIDGKSEGSLDGSENNIKIHFTFSGNHKGTFQVVYTAKYDGKTVTAESNQLTILSGNAGGENLTAPEASLHINDNNYPDNSTIISFGEYKVDIRTKLNTSGGNFTNGNLTLYVNGVVKDIIYLNSQSVIDSIKFSENNEWDVYMVYAGTCNGKIVTATSNHLKYINKIVSSENQTNSSSNSTLSAKANVNITINDVNCPSNATIISSGEYTAAVHYILSEYAKGYSDETLTLYVNGDVKQIIHLHSERINSFKIPENNEWDVYLLYTAKLNNQTVTSTSNHLKYITKSTKVTPEVSVSISDVTYPNPATAIVKANIDGKYNVIIGEDSYEANVKDGFGSVSFTLPAGTYTATAVSKTNTSVKNSTSFTVNPRVKTLPEIKSCEFVNGDSVSISVSLPNDINNEKITVKINNGNTKETAVANGNAVVEFKDLTAGDYSYTVSYGGNDKYNPTLIIKSFKISSNQPEVKNTLNITVNNVSSSERPTVFVFSNKDGEYSLIIGEKSYNLTVTEGMASIILPHLPAGNYTVSVVSKSNSSFTKSATFTVKKEVKEDESFNFDDGDGKSSSTFSINLPDDATGTLTVTVDGKTYSEELKNGKASITVDNLGEGEHNVVITYSGDDKYFPVSKNKVIVVNKTGQYITGYDGPTIDACDMVRGYKSPFDFKATFYDNNGKPLKNMEVFFEINKNVYPILTDESGVAKFVGQLKVGKYEVLMVNPVSGEKLIKNATIVNRITGNGNLKMDYSYTVTYKVRVFADNGNPAAAGESVVIKIDGKKVKTLKTDKNGYVTYKIKNNNLLPKTHTITAEYKGVKVSNKVVVKQILKSKNVKVKKSAKTKKFTATLKTSKGKAIKGKKITFKVKGKTYTAKTNKNGVATVKITNLKKAGKYTVTVKYLKTSVKKTITVKK